VPETPTIEEVAALVEAYVRARETAFTAAESRSYVIRGAHCAGKSRASCLSSPSTLGSKPTLSRPTAAGGGGSQPLKALRRLATVCCRLDASMLFKPL
jgi:hypothetical protein